MTLNWIPAFAGMTDEERDDESLFESEMTHKRVPPIEFPIRFAHTGSATFWNDK